MNSEQTAIQGGLGPAVSWLDRISLLFVGGAFFALWFWLLPGLLGLHRDPVHLRISSAIAVNAVTPVRIVGS